MRTANVQLVVTVADPTRRTASSVRNTASCFCARAKAVRRCTDFPNHFHARRASTNTGSGRHAAPCFPACTACTSSKNQHHWLAGCASTAKQDYCRCPYQMQHVAHAWNMESVRPHRLQMLLEQRRKSASVSCHGGATIRTESHHIGQRCRSEGGRNCFQEVHRTELLQHLHSHHFGSVLAILEEAG